MEGRRGRQHGDRAANARYGPNTITQLLRRRAGLSWMADAFSVVVGAASHPLAQPWDEILLVRYPSRGSMLDIQRGLPH